MFEKQPSKNSKKKHCQKKNRSRGKTRTLSSLTIRSCPKNERSRTRSKSLKSPRKRRRTKRIRRKGKKKRGRDDGLHEAMIDQFLNIYTNCLPHYGSLQGKEKEVASQAIRGMDAKALLISLHLVKLLKLKIYGFDKIRLR